MENKQLKSFKDLFVWQKAVDLATFAYSITEKFPRSELYGITNQMRRSAVSISSNIAEGFKRSHGKEKLQFYNIAYGSTAELESQIEISYKLNFLDNQNYRKLSTSVVEVGKMIDGLIKSQNRKFPKSPKSYILNSIFSLILLILIFYILNPSFANAARLYFEPQEQVVGTEGDFSVAIMIDASKPVNALAAAVEIPFILNPYDVSEGNSIINFFVDKPHFDETTRLLTFSGIIPGGFEGEKAPLLILKLKVNDRAQKTGNQTAVLSFDKGQTKAYLNTPDGLEDVLELEKMELPIVKGKENMGVGTIDVDAPESFKPEIAQDPNIFGGKWFLAFATQDKGSGIDHYEIREDLGFRIKNLGGIIKKFLIPKSYLLNSWQEVESPYVLKDQKLKSWVYIKAIDKAGNERIEVIPQKYPFQWYESWLWWGIIIVGFAIAYALKKFLWRKIIH